MKKRLIIWALAAVTLLSAAAASPAFAADGPETAEGEEADAQVVLSGGAWQARTADQDIAVHVDIIFNDLDRYNDELYLSYHVSDGEGELVMFEGERLPIVLGENGEVRDFPVTLSLASFPEAADLLDAAVEFDIVDEKNSYWFSQNTELVFRSACVVYDGHFPARLKTTILKAVERPVMLLANLAMCALFLAGAHMYWRSSRKTVLTGPFYGTGEQPLDRVIYEKYFTAAKYLGHGQVMCLANGEDAAEEERMNARFYAETMKWGVAESMSGTAGDRGRKGPDLCLIAGKADAMPVLRELKDRGLTPHVISFDFQGTDYDELMDWCGKNHYRYDARSFTNVVLKKENLIERLTY